MRARRLARHGRRRHGGPLGHDGRPRRRDPAGARRARLRTDRDHGLRREVLLGVLRSVPRRRRVGAAVRRPPVAPDGSGQRRRSAARGGAGHRGGRRHRDGQAGSCLSRRHRQGEGGVRLSDRRLPRQRRVRDAEGGGAQRLDRRATGNARDADVDPPRRRRHHHHLLRARSRPRDPLACRGDHGVVENT